MHTEAVRISRYRSVPVSSSEVHGREDIRLQDDTFLRDERHKGLRVCVSADHDVTRT